MAGKVEAKKLGLTDQEYEEILKILGREPNYLELALYSVMWSEHCSYKNSKPVLKRFPTEGPQVLQGPGENAGIVDIGDNLAIAMKIESHNHPTAVEPYHGAATGVGGIARDIFTMGAKPIAFLDSLRFGKLDDARVKYLFKEAVSGIADYGNVLETPTVGGEVFFEDSYKENPLVNAMCVGLVEHDSIVRARAAGAGNSVMLVGAPTGRDGIQGASFASIELDEQTDVSMHVGDPSAGKNLMEACLELLKKKWVIGVQDLGAAGLTSSSCETASRAGSGIELDVSKVFCREADMTPYEIMLSESQERMLVIIEKGHEDEVKNIFKTWNLDAVQVGVVTDDKMLRVLNNGEVVAEVPAVSLVEGAPVIKRESKKPAYMEELDIDISKVAVPEDLNEAFVKLLSSENIASKEWVYNQFKLNANDVVVPPGSDGAVIKIKGTKKGIALTTDCNGYYCYLDPYEGGKQAVADAARNLVVTGAKPLALTDCLNMGNPEKPEAYYQFEKCVDGIAEAAKALGTPVISGNVSFYNETKGKAIFPTPVIGMVGLLENVDKHCNMAFKHEGDLVVLLGENTGELGGTEYLKEVHGLIGGKPPKVDLEKEKSVQECCLKAIELGIINSAHDTSEGGLAVALAECCISGNLGFKGEVETDLRADGLLFGEDQSRIIVSLSKENLSVLQSVADELGVKHSVLGFVKNDGFKIDVMNQDKVLNKIDISLQKLADTWRNSIKCIME